MEVSGHTAFSRLSQVSGHLSRPNQSGASPPEQPPSKASDPQKVLPPSLIVICGWTGAPASYFSHYVARYAALYPSARTIVLETSFHDFTPSPLSTQQYHQRGLDEVVRELEPLVVSAPFGNVVAPGPGNSLLHVHVFSNGGCVRLGRLAERYLTLTGRPLPLRTLVLDSAPMPSSVWANSNAVATVLGFSWPVRAIGFLVVLCWVGSFRALAVATGQTEPVEKAMGVLEHPRVVRQEALRLYLYSRSDDIMDWRAIRQHAEAASRRGCVVRQVEMAGSRHCAHAKAHPDKYWSAVTSLWREASSNVANH